MKRLLTGMIFVVTMLGAPIGGSVGAADRPEGFVGHWRAYDWDGETGWVFWECEIRSSGGDLFLVRLRSDDRDWMEFHAFRSGIDDLHGYDLHATRSDNGERLVLAWDEPYPVRLGFFRK